jgi:exodeoxyribonuclease VII large subunit
MDSINTKQILSVSTLNDRIKTLIEEGFGFIWVEGEVSNLRRPASGHVYFTLKDSKSQIRAVIFRPIFTAKGGDRSASSTIEDGLSIICRARLSVYQPRGEYQLIVDAVEPKGLGALQKAFEQLKARLEAEGLFDQRRKKSLPFLPLRIGIITSPSGAVIRDILTITRRRFPSVNILIVPVRVQGAEAPEEIIRALGTLQIYPDVDVIILARGGGSLEDLSPFNDEGVARAIARSCIPVISAIGHETDYTIADFTADLRAATPSAAAELAVPHRADLMEAVETLNHRLIRRQRQMMERLRENVKELSIRLKDPKRRLADGRIALDDHVDRMRMSLSHLREVRRQEWVNLTVRLEHRNPRLRIADINHHLENLLKDLRGAREKQEGHLKNRLQSATALLDSLSPLSVLNRGYSITRRFSDGLIIRRSGEVAAGQEVNIRLATGTLQAMITDIRH